MARNDDEDSQSAVLTGPQVQIGGIGPRCRVSSQCFPRYFSSARDDKAAMPLNHCRVSLWHGFYDSVESIRHRSPGDRMSSDPYSNNTDAEHHVQLGLAQTLCEAASTGVDAALAYTGLSLANGEDELSRTQCTTLQEAGRSS